MHFAGDLSRLVIASKLLTAYTWKCAETIYIMLKQLKGNASEFVLS
jgi:hypothetical protein